MNIKISFRIVTLLAAIGFVALSFLALHNYDEMAGILASVSTDLSLYWVLFVAFVSGVLVVLPYTRLLGWFLAGNCIAMSVLSCFLLKEKFPTAFTYRGSLFVSSDLLLLWGSIGFGAGVLSLFHGLLAAKITDGQHTHIKSLEDRTQKLEERVKEENDYKEQLRREKAETDLQSRQIIEKLRAEVVQESERRKDAKRKRPYESQLMMLLAISLFTEWRRKYDTVPFALNSFQGNLDRNLADIFGATNKFCWLLELKRGRGEISSEWEKTIRKLQGQRIQKDERIRNIADKCHWLAWGEEDQTKNTILKFSKYWRIGNLGFDPESNVDNGAFAQRAFSADAAAAIGVPYNEMKDYLEFLLDATKGTSPAAFDGSFAILAFSWSPETGVRCWSLDMESLGRVIGKTLSQEREMTQSLSKELEWDRDDREIDPPTYTLGI